jgi:cyclic pyranopterin phosphate synthase
MVNVGDKKITQRNASASVTVRLNPGAFKALEKNRSHKGDILAAANLAGIQAAKKTSELIPLCHQIPLDHVDLDFELDKNSCSVTIVSRIACSGRTGVEMEALTACSVAALTIYDMLKAIQKDILITDLLLLEKKGGKSGEYIRQNS